MLKPKINVALAADAYNAVQEYREISKMYDSGYASYIQFNNHKKFAVANIANTSIKNIVGTTGVFFAGKAALLYGMEAMNNQVPNVLDFFTQDIFRSSAISLAATIYVMYTLADKYKDTLQYDLKSRTFHIEDLTKNFEFDINSSLLKTAPTAEYDYLYIRMMNKLLIMDGIIDKGVGVLFNSVKAIKEGFSGFKNFSKVIAHKAFEHILEVKIIKNLIKNETYNELKKDILDFKKRSEIEKYDFKSFVKDATNIEKSKKLSNQLSKLCRKIHGEGEAQTPSKFKQILYDINERSLIETYNIDMNQKLVIKFSKLVIDASKNGHYDLNEFKKFALLDDMSKYKTHSGNVKNYVHAEISKIAKHLINDTVDFKKQYSKKSFLDIVKQIDNLMIKDNKVVLRDFRDIFHSSRELKLDGNNTENQKTLKSTILSKLKSNNIEYNDISLNSDIKSDEKIWKKANKKIKPN